MSQFNYLVDKLDNADFVDVPFKHIYIENFLSDEHFNHIVNAPQINFRECNGIDDLISELTKQGYNPVTFPGCTSDIQKYVKWYKGNKKETFTHGLLEGIGMSMRMTTYKDDLLKELVDFLNTPEFHDVIKKKFDREGKTRVETAIQKYLDGYEISPHPDIRSKCLTYMVNINPAEYSDTLNIHTHYCKFKPEYEKIYDFWRDTDEERCWVPWSWCETVKTQTKNNSIVMFAPADDTLHAVRAHYDHNKTQRTQIYGNLWFTEKKKAENLKYNIKNWKDLNDTLFT